MTTTSTTHSDKTPPGFSFRNEMKPVFLLVRVCFSQKLPLKVILKVFGQAQSGLEEAKATSAALPRLCQDVFEHYLSHARAFMMRMPEATDRSGNRSPVDHAFLCDVESDPTVGL